MVGTPSTCRRTAQEEATIDSPENVKATQLMVDVIKNGGAPEAVTTYAYALNEKAAKVKGKFKVAPLPEFEGAGPFSAELKQAVSQAKARPVSPVYPQISQAIYMNVNAALGGQQSAEDAMKNAQADIEKALATF